MLFDSLSNNFSVSATLTGPGGVNPLNINAGSDSSPFSLPRSGTYTLTLTNNSGNTQPFDFKLLDLQGGDASQLTLGTTITATPSAGYATSAYTFQGELGQRLFFDGQGGNEWFTLYGPGGVMQVLNSSSSSDSNLTTLLENGTYYLVGNNNASSTTQLDWSLSDATAAPALESGGR